MSKRKEDNQKKIIKNKLYSIKDGIRILKNLKKINFKESIDVSFNLNIDSKKTEQNIKGFTVLPHGTGKKIKIAVFATGNNAIIAKKYGANYVGMEDLEDIIRKNPNKFDLIIASPETMTIVNKLGQILGPRGLMPNPKFGTITENIEKSVKEAKFGIVRYKNDKNGIIHVSIGKNYFSEEQLYENFLKIYNIIKKYRINSIKGFFFKKISITTTMGPGITIDHLSI